MAFHTLLRFAGNLYRVQSFDRVIFVKGWRRLVGSRSLSGPLLTLRSYTLTQNIHEETHRQGSDSLVPQVPKTVVMVHEVC